MPESNKTNEFLQKLAPCIERGELEKCVEEAARLAGEMGVGAEELFGFSAKKSVDGKYDFAYVLALAAAHDLEGNKKARAYNSVANAARYLRKFENAEQKYKLAIDADPKYGVAHYNYAILLSELKRNEEAEEQYKLAIAVDPNDASAHYNYANLLSELKRNQEAEKHYLLAIEISQKSAKVQFDYAKLLQRVEMNKEAEQEYKEAIDSNPNLVVAHGGYGFLLVEMNRREEALEHINEASDFLSIVGLVVESHLLKAWFYQTLSEKNLSRKRFGESGKDANEAGEEYLKAASIAEGFMKDNLIMQGNVLKAKSCVRKIPEKSWYKIFYIFKSPDIPELIENLKNAAIYYKKASLCPIGEKKDVCNACFFSMNVFSDTLDAMSAFINGDDAEININKWSDSLEQAYKIYSEKNLNKGVALVETLKQLIKCVDELAEHRKYGNKVKEEKLGKCLNNLIEVSNEMEGALKVIAEHSAEAIRDYAKKQGMGFVKEEKIEKPSVNKWLIGVLVAIVLGIISNRLFSWDIDLKIFRFFKSLFFGADIP
ncbi:MAG: tetratricopeptide repeat protein [Candidatus Methanoperedens sp.]|nr:tetratricopeptide repeat protein [Candidatus Methanoperedens sp.]